ncbi:hypothetical protein ACUWFG_26700, partial [Escherichia coli]
WYYLLAKRFSLDFFAHSSIFLILNLQYHWGLTSLWGNWWPLTDCFMRKSDITFYSLHSKKCDIARTM